MLSLIYLLIAIVVIGFLIFIHELGHYFMARHVGMKVEAFGIGFGRAIYTWMHDGVEWRLNWMPFGGYVKIKGVEEESSEDPYDVEDSFFGKPPIDRIKVSLAGPLVNLAMALVAFGLLWALGGRSKEFSDYTPKIGWLDSNSQLYQAGIRPGDEITHYGDHVFTSTKDHLYSPMTADETLRVRGVQIDYLHGGVRKPFDLEVNVYPHPLAFDKGLETIGVLNSADYLIYSPEASLKDELTAALAEGSPLHQSGIEAGDRIVWANGETIFSQAQMAHLINDDRVLLTIQRGSKKLLRRVPTASVEELRIDPNFREELTDWQYEAGIVRRKVGKLQTIPYNLSDRAVVEERLGFIDEEAREEAFPESPYSIMDEPLLVGDRVIAVAGQTITEAHHLIAKIQEPTVLMVVLRETSDVEGYDVAQANTDFSQEINWEHLQEIVASVGSAPAVKNAGNLHLLDAIVPKKHIDFALNEEMHEEYQSRFKESLREIESIEDPERRAVLKELLETSEERLHLGPPYFKDRKVVYNPGPTALFGEVFAEIWRTLSALVTGNLSPKWISGPVGLVQVVQHNWSTSTLEGLFWLGTISLNLGILNLLPIPVLDGGSICFSLFELVTRRKIKLKTMEKLIIPFAILLLLFFVYLTFNDLGRVFSRLLG